MEEPGFWDNPERSTKLVREAKHLKDEVDTFRELEQEYEDIQTMIQMGYEENDASLIPEIQEMLDHFSETLEKMRMKLLLSGEYDGYDAILRLNAGAGGTESCDWCSMLYRMYCRWADKKGFTTEVLDYLDGDEAGIKSVIPRRPALPMAPCRAVTRRLIAGSIPSPKCTVRAPSPHCKKE